MKIALAQINSRIGDFQANAKKIRRQIERAKDSGASLVVFPELTTTGYPPQDLLDFSPFIQKNKGLLEDVVESAEGVTVVCGFVEKNTTSVGRPFHNAAAVIQDKKIVHVYSKRLLPNYDVFDEARYFEPGHESQVFTVDGVRFGLSICEDAWNGSKLLDQNYADDPLRDYESKVDVLLNLAASPFHLGRPEQRIDLFREVSQRLKSGVLFCNQVGGQDELIFDGCSLAISQKGDVVAAAKSFEEELLIVDSENLKNGSPIQPSWPSSEPAWLCDSLELGIRDYVHKVDFKSVCLGLSGGIDSAVLAALAARALGPDQVLAVGLPTRFTINESTDSSEELAKNLGIQFRVCGIETIYKLYENLLIEWFHKSGKGTTLENLQPRIRMTVLMMIANENRRLLISTSNKSEVSTGYATLYGDTAGALAPLGDLTKGQVYDLANYMNSERPTIPQSIIDRPPTAELKDNQKDEDTLPPYETLDAMVRASVEKRQGAEEMAKSFSEEDVTRFRQLNFFSEFKRRQLPPVLRISPKAFGSGRRIPIACVREGI